MKRRWTDLTLFGRERIRGVRRGVTLVELLVTISLILVLIGVLLPVVGKARRSALEVSCRNNLRQIGLLFSTYHFDSARRFVPVVPLYSGDHSPNWVYAVDQAGLRAAIKYCPQWNDDSSRSESSYMANMHLVRPWQSYQRWLKEKLSPSNVVLLGENLPNSNQLESRYNRADIVNSIGWNRHGRLRSNILWLDQHVTGVEDIEDVIRGWDQGMQENPP